MTLSLISEEFTRARLGYENCREKQNWRKFREINTHGYIMSQRFI